MTGPFKNYFKILDEFESSATYTFDIFSKIPNNGQIEKLDGYRILENENLPRLRYAFQTMFFLSGCIRVNLNHFLVHILRNVEMKICRKLGVKNERISVEGRDS